MGEGSKNHNNLKDYTIYLTPIKNKFANKKKIVQIQFLKWNYATKVRSGITARQIKSQH